MRKHKDDKFPITVRTPFGLETVLAGELSNLGAEDIQVMGRAVTCSGDQRLLYLCNLALRTAGRVLLPINKFAVPSEKRLYTEIKNITWEDIIARDKTIAIHTVSIASSFRNSHFLSLKAKDAIVDRMREQTGLRPSVDLENPDIVIDLQIYKNHCTLSLDSSGPSLHKRGYKTAARSAPLNEVLAAGLILLTDWRGKKRFIDPMCGGATLLTEAAMIAANRAPGLTRDYFALQSWNDFNPQLWDSVIDELRSKERAIQCEIIGYDSSTTAMKLARANFEKLDFANNLRLEQLPLDQQNPPTGGGLVIMNPPYGERLKKHDIESFYKMIGDTLKKSYTGYEAWIISSNLEAFKKIGLKPTKKVRLFNGSLECSYRQYELYSGSKS